MIPNNSTIYFDKINNHLVVSSELKDKSKLYDRLRFIPLGIVLYSDGDSVYVISPYFIKYSIDLKSVKEKKLKKYINEEQTKFISNDLLKHIKTSSDDVSIVDSTETMISYVANNAKLIYGQLLEICLYSGIANVGEILKSDIISYFASENTELSFLMGGFGALIENNNYNTLSVYDDAYKQQTQINVYSAEEFFNISMNPIYVDSDDVTDKMADSTEEDETFELTTFTYNEIKTKFKKAELIEFFHPTFLKINIL